MRTAQRADLRQDLSAKLALGNTLPLWIAPPLLLGLISIAIWWTFRPLLRLEGHIERLEPLALTPLDADLAPREVRGLVRAINALLARLARPWKASASLPPMPPMSCARPWPPCV